MKGQNSYCDVKLMLQNKTYWKNGWFFIVTLTKHKNDSSWTWNTMEFIVVKGSLFIYK